MLFQTPNEAYTEFIRKYKIKINKKYIKREPWVTPGLLTSSRTREKLLSKKLHKPTQYNIYRFKHTTLYLTKPSAH